MPITRLSVQALRILEENPQARIHSAFTSAVNLQAGERLITCSPGAISAPHGVEMSPGDLAQLQRLHGTSPAEVLDWQPHERAIVSRSGKLVISSAPQTTVFDTALPTCTGASITGSVDGLIGHLARTRARTGLGSEWVALTADRHLTHAVESLLDSRVDDPVLYWLGRGPGLTPSGDDVLVGMIAALWFAGSIDSSIMTPVRQFLEYSARQLTTDISVEYLHYACRGIVIGALRDLLVTLDRSDTSGTADAVNRLQRFGHTSGMDCLLGAVTALRHLGRAHRHAPHHAGTSRPAASARRRGSSPREMPIA
jgi:Protein of unknown function (DUF2877)